MKTLSSTKNTKKSNISNVITNTIIKNIINDVIIELKNYDYIDFILPIIGNCKIFWVIRLIHLYYLLHYYFFQFILLCVLDEFFI